MPKVAVISGRLVDPANYSAADWDLLDVSHPLSNQCRFAGHTTSHYSVAQHSRSVAILARQLAHEGGVSEAMQDTVQLQGLLHDAHEAYVIDLPKPIRDSEGFEAYRELEKKMFAVIMQIHQLPTTMMDIVRRADEIMLVSEAEHFWGVEAARSWGSLPDVGARRVKIEWQMPHEARIFFERMYRELEARRTGR